MTDIVLKAHEDLLSFDVSDDALELAAGAARIGASFTLGLARACLSVPVDPVSCISRHFWRDRHEAVFLFALTSAIGTKRTFVFALPMSAFGGKADMRLCTANVCL